MSIIEFLEARIAEDEKKASALLRDLQGQSDEEYAAIVDDKGPMTPARLLSAQMWAHYDGQSKRRSFAKGQQIAYLANPERVLAECAAKRAIIGEHVPVDYSGFGMVSPNACSLCGADHSMHDWEWVENSFPCPTIKALAAIYADHPEYQQEWKI